MRLELYDGPGGLRHMLGGRVVEAGAKVEVWIARPDFPSGGFWLEGRYEWPAPGSAPALAAPGLYILLDPHAVLRWPRERPAERVA